MIVAIGLLTSSMLFATARQAGAPAPRDTLPPALAEARDDLTAGHVERAIALAKDYTRFHRNDERGYLVLGDAYYHREVTGRYPAWQAYHRAAQLNARDPAAPYGMALAGWYLGPPDGERLARGGFEQVLAIDPLYKDAWARWSRLYRDDDGRRKVIAMLEKHAMVPTVAGWIAQMEIELGDDSAARATLAPALARDSTDPMLLALAAQRAFDQGDSIEGWDAYRAALAHADRDAADYLWHQAMAIASPDEVRMWRAGIPADQKPAWFKSFWERRNPDLFSPINHRVAEQFERLRYVLRDLDAVYHPLGRAMRSAEYRNIWFQVSPGELKEYAECEMNDEGGLERFRVLPEGFAMDQLDSTVNVEDYERVSGRGAEGVAYLRFGAPEKIMHGAPDDDPHCPGPLDLDRWTYSWGELRFARMGSELKLRPLAEKQVQASQHLLRHDASSVPVDSTFAFWTAQFRDTAATGRTDIQVYATSGTLAATLIGGLGGSRGTVRAQSGHIELNDQPGTYQLLANSQDADSLGHRHLGRRLLYLVVRDMQGPAMSDMLLGLSWGDSAPARAAALAHVFVNLTFTSRDTIRAYSELYGLATEDGRARYQATYEVLKTKHPWEDAEAVDWSGGTSFTFTRTARPTLDGTIHEVLDLAPSMVGAGTFLLRLNVRDLIAERDVGHTTIPFVVR